jgi:menaquinone-dependent protoporphyrinogen IX oxidase
LSVKTLIAYETKGGATAKSASIIAEVLRNDHGHEVDIVNLRENRKPDISGYDNVIIGSGIRIGMWYGRAKRFLGTDFKGKKVAVFLSSMRAGDPKQYEAARARYIDRVLSKKMKTEPVAAEAFGGWYKKKGEVTDNNLDPDKVRAWAGELGRILSS